MASSLRAVSASGSVASLAVLLLFGACGDSTGPDDPGREVAAYLADLPSWSEFSPPQPNIAPTATGAPDTLPTVTTDVRQVEEDGSVTVIPDVNYRCVSTPFTFQDTPERIVMYSPDTELLWPGALIQGRSYRDGLGSLLGLPIAERAPIRVSIPGFATEDNFRLVEQPGQAAVASAVGSIVGNATATGLSAPSTISFQQRAFNEEKEFGLSIGVSGRYLGFSAAATGDFERRASETTVTAHFFQKMFEVVVEPPQTPGAFFSAGFTPAKLQEQVGLGRIGPDNLPVYVSNIVYGRMMIFSFTSTASEEEIRATLSAAYSSIGVGVEVNLSARHKKLLAESRIAVASLGGNADATLAVIRSGDWSQYFSDDAPLSSAAPLSYTFRNLGDGSIAKVTEATDYNLTECRPVPAIPGTFSFLDPQATALRIPAPVRTVTGDIDGDGRMDLIWNHLGASNQIYVGLSNGDGTFQLTQPVQHPETSPPGGWGTYTVRVADINGNNLSDLVWSRTAYPAFTYVGLGNGDGTFTFQGGQTFTHLDAAASVLRTDMDGDGKDDMVWEHRTGSMTTNVQVGRSTGAGFEFLPRWQGNMNTDAAFNSCFELRTGNVTGDNRNDLVWSTRGCTRAVAYLGQSQGNGTWTLQRYLNSSLADATRFATRVGDLTGSGRVDVIWADTAAGDHTRMISVAQTTAAGTLQFLPLQQVPYEALEPLRVRLADVDGDGDMDLIWNTTGTVNRVDVSLATSTGVFDLSPLSQYHPALGISWDQYELFVGDVNGNGRADLVWNRAAAENRIYVALARQ